jgi:hypothetical protein
VVQTMYIHEGKCKNDKIKGEKKYLYTYIVAELITKSLCPNEQNSFSDTEVF